VHIVVVVLAGLMQPKWMGLWWSLHRRVVGRPGMRLVVPSWSSQTASRLHPFGSGPVNMAVCLDFFLVGTVVMHRTVIEHACLGGGGGDCLRWSHPVLGSTVRVEELF
jgi:hypothetical protein